MKLRVFGIFFLGLLAGLIWISIFQLPDNYLHLVFCDVGQGDAILVIKRFTQVLIDGGPNEKVLSCLANHLPFWDRQIEVIVLTHPEYDHLTGLIPVIQRYRILQIVSNSLGAESGIFKKFRAEVFQRKIPVHSPAKGEEIKTGEIKLRILFPEEKLGQEIIWRVDENQLFQESQERINSAVLGAFSPYRGNFNETSIVGLLEFDQFQAFFPGDIGIKEEEKIIPQLKSMGGEIEVLKVAHHGSKSSTSREFLGVIRPKLAVISVGVNNRYGHPAKEVLEYLREVGAKVLRTDREGEIEVVSDGKKWYVASKRITFP